MNDHGINVLSLFNGMGCIWLALDKLGIDVNRRYSSEVDKYAIKVNDANYPDTVQLGDVTKVRAADLDRIDLLVGGSPCQGFSSAGKGLNFDDPRSKLFFEFVRLLEESKPRWFLLENVSMKKDHQDVITKLLGIEPQEINSGIFCAQSRKRVYWTNLPVVKLPEDKGIVVRDILEPDGVVPAGLFAPSDKTFVPITPKTSRTGIRCVGGLLGPKSTLWGKQDVDVSSLREHYRTYAEGGKWSTLTTQAEFTDHVLLDLPGRHFRQNTRVFNPSAKSPTLGATSESWWVSSHIRRLTRREMERLQTVPDNYTEAVSRSQAAKMLGNGWTVDVIAHLLQPVLCDLMIDDALTLKTD